MDYTTQMDYGTSFLVGALETYGVALFILMLVLIVAKWRIFEKWGEPGWKMMIPFYNTYIQMKYVMGSGACMLIYLAGIIPIIGWLVIAIFTIIFKFRLAIVFGQSKLFAVGLILLTPIFYIILAFGSSEYTGDKVTNKNMMNNNMMNNNY